MASTPYGKNHHVVPLSYYAANLIALLVLMGLTVWASEQEFHGFLFLSGHMVNNIVALGIATLKAILVVMVFMGVWWSSKLTKMWVVISFTWFLLMGIIFADYATRKYEPVKPWEPVGDTALPRAASPKSQPITDSTLENVHPRF